MWQSSSKQAQRNIWKIAPNQKGKKKNIIKRRSGLPTPREVCGTAVRMRQNKAAGVRRVGPFHKSLHKRALAVIHEGSRLIRDALGPPCLSALLLAYVIKMTPALQRGHGDGHYLLAVFPFGGTDGAVEKPGACRLYLYPPGDLRPVAP